MSSNKFKTPTLYHRLVSARVFFLFLFIIISKASFADMPDYYSEPGLNPNRDYSSTNGYETVDPFTGKLQLHHTDIFLPGNGGMDLKVQRSYTSLNSLGVAAWTNPWSMHFGYVSNSSATTSICAIGQISNKKNPILVLPNGSTQVLSDSDNLGSYNFISKQHWKATCATNGNGLIVTSPEGTIYEMTYNGSNISQQAWFAQKITDKNGNWMSITYSNNNGNGVHVTGVSTSDGRNLIYSYTTQAFGYETLSSISGAGGTWTYSYTQLTSGGQLVTGAYLLTTVTRPDGLSWQYSYNADSSGAGSRQIHSVTNPSGGLTTYAYGTTFFYFSGSFATQDEVITSKSVTGLGAWTYSYAPSTGFGVPDTTTAIEPSRTITYTHIGYNTVANVGETWKIGLLTSKTISSSQTETYNWTPQLLCQQNDARVFPWVTKVDTENYVPLLASKTITRDGATFTTSYSGYDAYDNPSTVAETGSASRTITRTYSVNTAKWVLHQLASENNTGFTTSYSFDGNQNVISENKYGVVTFYGRTAAGDISSITDARAKVKTLSNYYRGIPQTESYPDASVISRAVNSAGTIASETDGVGATVAYAYDSLNRPTIINRPLGNGVSIVWGATSRVLTRGNFKEVTSYDSHYRPTSISRTDTTTGAVIKTSMTNDALGRKVFESLLGSTTGTSYTYDALDRLKTVTFANGTTNNYAYSGSSVIFTNERGLSYTYGYRTYGNPDAKELLSISAPIAAASMTISRNAIGHPLTITQNGVTRSYAYAANAFLTSEVNPETGTTVYSRDAVGNMSTRKVSTSAITSYTYDPMNRVSAITYSAGTPSVSFTYDKAGQVLNSISAPVTRVNTYDANRSLTSETLSIDALNYKANYSYNANDTLSSTMYPSGQLINYAPDAFGRQTSAMPYATSVSYHPSGQPTNITLANGVVTNYSYQARYWPSAMAINKGATPLVNTAYAYGLSGNMTGITDVIAPNNYNRTLNFDAIDRLVIADSTSGLGNIAYDSQGNISSQQYGGFNLAYSYDANNRLTTVIGGRSFSMSYDVYGNVINNGSTTFQYDDASNMRCTNCALSTKVNYDYDANHIRSKKLVGTTATYYFYGLNGSLLGEYTPASQLEKEYYYLGSKLLAERQKTGVLVPSITYYHNDVLGSPIAATDTTGTLKWREDYRPYGDRNFNDANAATETRWFAGKAQDADSRLSYFGARYYDPMLGRFMGMDSVGVSDTNIHSHNRYAYANNNPYKFVDPDGREATLALCAGGPVACGVGVALAGATAYYGVKALQDTNAILQSRADKGGDGAELLRGVSAAASPGGMPPEDEGKNSKDNDPKDAKDFKKLSNGEIKKLKNNDIDVHELKGKGSSRYDLYKDKKGDVYQTLKQGKGEPRSTGINIKELK